MRQKNPDLDRKEALDLCLMHSLYETTSFKINKVKEIKNGKVLQIKCGKKKQKTKDELKKQSNSSSKEIIKLKVKVFTSGLPA